MCGIYIVVYITVYLLYICSRSLSLPTSSNMHYLDISIIYSTRIATCSSPPSPLPHTILAFTMTYSSPSLPSSPPSCLVCCLSLALAATFALPFALLQIGFHHNNVLRGGVYNPNTSVYTCPLSCSPSPSCCDKYDRIRNCEYFQLEHTLSKLLSLHRSLLKL